MADYDTIGPGGVANEGKANRVLHVPIYLKHDIGHRPKKDLRYASIRFCEEYARLQLQYSSMSLSVTTKNSEPNTQHKDPQEDLQTKLLDEIIEIYNELK